MIRRYGVRSRMGARPAPPAPVREAAAFLEAHHHRQVSVGEAAAVAGLSEHHFMRSFRARTGLSVHAWLTQIRLRRARDLLASGFGAAEVALMAGFYDQSHLINQFRRHFGVTPGAFVVASRQGPEAAVSPRLVPTIG